MNPPNPSEVEITVFGAGYGEAIVIHVGSGRWILVDSCLDNAGNPAALGYLKQLGVDVASQVAAVAASHWHDDHIKGISRVLDECRSASLCLSSALQRQEFVGLLEAFEAQPVTMLDRGGTEVLKCLRIAKLQCRRVKPLTEDSIIIDWDSEALEHRQRVELRALSPSGQQFLQFLRRVEQYIDDSEGQAKKRMVEPNRNDLSVAMLLTVGERAVLLGADLEQSKNRDHGWNAIVERRRGRQPQASVFKVPHHGSANAHCDDVWTDLLSEQVISVVTPWQKGGRSLPSYTDSKRIADLSFRAYITSSNPDSVKRRYSRNQWRTIQRVGMNLSCTSHLGGMVTFRWSVGSENPSVELRGGAKRLF